MASVLKPVDDTRMFEKIGSTLSASGQFDVTIIGYPTQSQSTHPTIKFLPLNSFNRLSLKRLLAPWKVFKMINQVKPELILINTPELLPVAFLNRILFGRKIVYDVLENYYRNIRFTPAFPRWSRLSLASLVRLTEYVTKPFISFYILAEKGYVNELKFSKPFIVAENKLPKFLAEQYQRPVKTGHHHLLFSGTLAPTTGILEAINLCKGLHKVDSCYTLSIIGYSSLPPFLDQIKSEISGADYIHLIGGDMLVPHSKILSEISRADIGIIIYSVNSSTQSSIPTKLYEYLALSLPVLIKHNEESHAVVHQLKAGIILPESIDFALLDKQLASISKPEDDPTLYWDQEGEKVINALKII